MDMLGPLLGSTSPKGKEVDAMEDASAELCDSRTSVQSGLSEYVNKMSISESSGKRSKLSNDSQGSGCSSMSIGSAVSAPLAPKLFIFIN